MSYQDPFKPRPSLVLNIFKHLKKYCKKSGLALIFIFALNLALFNWALGCHVELSIEKSDSPDPIQPGQEITYSLWYRVKVLGMDTTNLVITDELPPEVSFVSASDGGTESGGVVTWNLGDVSQNPGKTWGMKSGTVNLVVRVNDDVANNTIIENTAELRTDEAGPKQGTTTTTVEAPEPQVCELELTKEVDKTEAAVGDTLTYTLHYQNIGNADCTGTGVKIEDVLAEDITYVAGSNTESVTDDTDGQGLDFGYGPASGYDEDSHTLTWNAHTVSPGEQGLITFQIEVLARYSCGDFNIENYFSAWSPEEGDKNSNTVTTLVSNPCTFCGDSEVQTPNNDDINEECDLGTDQNGQVCEAGYGETCNYCSSECTEEIIMGPYCGDEIKNGEEECDGQDGVGEGQSCNNSCELVDIAQTYCGDNEIQTPNDDDFDEECDDGNDNGVVCEAGYGETCDYCSDSCEIVAVTGPYCGDEIKNGEEECDGEDGVTASFTCNDQCQLETVGKGYCGDGQVDHPNSQGQNEECDDGNNNDGDGCSFNCVEEREPPCTNCGGGGGGGPTPKYPRLLMTKEVDKVFVYAGENVVYTLKITNIGAGVGDDLTVTDSLPNPFTYEDTSESLVTFDLGDIGIYETKEISYTVKVSPEAVVGIYENNAVARVTNGYKPNNEAYATVEVRVKERTTSPPILTLEKSHEVSFANPGDVVTYTLVITNAGDEIARGVTLDDLLPDGFFPQGGTIKWDLGDIGPGEIKRIEHQVVIGEEVTAGDYENTAILTATNHERLEDSDIIEVRVGEVLGVEFEELPDTGNGGQVVVYFLAALTAFFAGVYVYRQAS